jgi:FlaA1/EpsC-like NDP-sugar epimerase
MARFAKLEQAFGWLGKHRTLASGLAYAGIVSGAYVASFALRFDLAIPGDFTAVLLRTLPLLLACKLVGFWYSGLFSGTWRHVSVRDVQEIVRGNLLGSVVFLLAMVFVRGLHGFPRTVFLIDFLVATALVGGIRVVIRVLRERDGRPQVRRIEKLALIAGAGSAGIQLLQELESRPRLGIAVVGFVDDDPGKVGLRVCGLPVLGTIDDLPALCAEHEVGEVFIAMPSATGAVIRRAAQRCAEAGVRSRILPSLGELVEGRFIYTQMREVKVDDLLSRAPVRLDLPRVRHFIARRTVLVTGAAGSIGSELCRQLAASEPERVLLYDRHENGVFALELELAQRFPDVTLVPILGDVLLPDQLDAVFATYRPQIVFHAAAYKHVPLAERNVVEAVRNNVLGTRNVAQAALRHGAREFVLVSTDKAVRPTSVMGVTKRVAELVVQGMQNGGCRFVAVRFGNVLGSNGSVVPTFREQIARGGPVTVTHPEVTRYFMTIPEAVQLILQAATLGGAGQIVLLEMGEPVRIADLARHMIELSGFRPDEDIEVVFTGLRPGEKLYEELVDEGEEVVRTELERIRTLRAHAGARVAPHDFVPRFEELVAGGDVDGIVRLLAHLVPTYTPSAGLHVDPAAEADSGASRESAAAHAA